MIYPHSGCFLLETLTVKCVMQSTSGTEGGITQGNDVGTHCVTQVNDFWQHSVRFVSQQSQQTIFTQKVESKEYLAVVSAQASWKTCTLISTVHFLWWKKPSWKSVTESLFFLHSFFTDSSHTILEFCFEKHKLGNNFSWKWAPQMTGLLYVHK